MAHLYRLAVPRHQLKLPGRRLGVQLLHFDPQRAQRVRNLVQHCSSAPAGTRGWGKAGACIVDGHDMVTQAMSAVQLFPRAAMSLKLLLH